MELKRWPRVCFFAVGKQEIDWSRRKVEGGWGLLLVLQLLCQQCQPVECISLLKLYVVHMQYMWPLELLSSYASPFGCQGSTDSQAWWETQAMWPLDA